MKNFQIMTAKNQGLGSVTLQELKEYELVDLNGGSLHHYFSISPGWLNHILEFADGFTDAARDCDCF